MLAYLVSLENSAGSFPLFASYEGLYAQRTAVSLSQDYPEALIMMTPVQFSESSLTRPSLFVLPSPLIVEQPNGLIEVLASHGNADRHANSALDPHLWPEQVIVPAILSSNYGASQPQEVSLRA
ncbi:hypothetical protein IC232_03435 [Microvirga sp. BT688]|uniref:hypothetical protein n=1 Tax=Microvirga sp. TaxID=1873136 RepID=UPI00168474AF|nr:hypothetical protein [Microvirga sp.]MBD2745742.1 hypothetical protein [Microvirga sp.]